MNHGDRQLHGMPVPLVNEIDGAFIYDKNILRFAILFGGLGAILFGWIGYALAAGDLALGGLGQWAAAGDGPATFAGACLGAAGGGLKGALIAIYRMPARHAPHQHQESSS